MARKRKKDWSISNSAGYQRRYSLSEEKIYLPMQSSEA
nr:MAG TPA: hypothetical protein [Caudoviricetes sp.]